MPCRRSALITFILLTLNLSDLFCQVDIDGWRHNNRIYCSTEESDTLYGKNPSGKDFYFDDTIYSSHPALQRGIDEKGEMAIFYPSKASIGTHKIKYTNPGSGKEITYDVIILESPIATFAPIPNVCSTSPLFSLFNADSSNVSPKNGIFSGTGVDAFGNFNPAIAGPDTHTITYTAGVGGCQSSFSRTITVDPAPIIGFNPFSPVCEGTPPLLLTQGFPAGGTYSGPGVDASGRFDQSVTGTGSFTITYTYSKGACTTEAKQNIVVSPRPSATFSGLDNLYCPDDPGVDLTGNPASVTSSFTGPGITDNGNGTALFEPVKAGLGLHQVQYIYISPEGCADTAYQQVQVGTNVTLSGLASQYCVNNDDVIVSATPAGGTYSITPSKPGGLTDKGDGTAIFSPSKAGPGIYTVEYTFTDANGCINFRSIQVSVYALPEPSIINLAASYCANNPLITISGNFQPSGTFSGPGISDNGNGTAIFNPLLLVPGNSYPVTYKYTDPVTGCAASVTNSVLINPLPSANISEEADICLGSAADLSVSVSGSAPFSLSLTDGTGTYVYNGVTGPVFNTQMYPSDTVIYTISEIVDSRGCKSSGSGSARFNVLPLVTITSQPVSKNACPGTDISLSVSAEGVNLKYQWQKNGSDIAGATNATLALINVQASDIGIYRCIVTGDCGLAVTSNEASVELLSPVKLKNQPSDVYECEGSSSLLQVTATGSNLSYQWFKNNSALPEGSGYTGTALADLSIGPLAPSMAGNYHVRVTGTCGTVESNTVSVKVDRTINIISHPSDVTICEGNKAVFRTEASGDNLSYQWQLNGSDIPGETSDVLTIENSVTADEGFYRCIVRSGCGSEVATNAAQLSVLIKPVITSNPVSVSICEGDNAVFRVIATGTSNVFKWHKDGVPLVNGGRISGSNGSTLSISGVTGSDIGKYNCIIYSACDSIVSSNASLSVDTSLAIFTQPESLHKCLDENAIFQVTATGNNLSYQWFKNGISMSGQTGRFLVLNNIKADDAAVYHCLISNSCGKTVKSIDATLIIDQSTNITESPVDIIVCEGENAAFTIKASGKDLSYQWEFNGAPLTDNGSLSGSGAQTLIIGSAEQVHQGVYNCYVQGRCGKERSGAASLLVNDTMTITKQPVGDTVCEGNNASFHVVATGASGYQWQKDGTDIPGATGEWFVIPNVSSSDSGVYSCIVFSFCDTLASDGALLTVKKQPQITSHPVSLTSCENLKVSFKAEASGSDIKWQWMRGDGSPVMDGKGIQGSRSSVLVIDSVKVKHAGIYYASITGYCSSDIKSNSASLSVIPAPVILQQPENSEACENHTTSFQVAVAGNVTYQWLKDNVILPGETSESLVLKNISLDDSGSYRCRVTGECRDIYSDDALLKVNQNPLIKEQPVGVTTCDGDVVTLRVSAAGSGLTYRWKKDGNYLTDDANISGSAGPILTIENSLPAHSGLYQCEIAGVCGTELSSSANVKVNSRIQITEQPVPVTQCEGLNVAFRVSATGSGLTCRWQKNGVDIPGANAYQFDIAAVTKDNAGIYRCIIEGDCGQVISEEVKLTVELAAVITDQPPTEVHICEGNVLSAGFTAEGEGLIYQWYRDGKALSDDGVLTGSNKPSLLINPALPSHEGIYHCEIRNSCPGTATSGMQVWIDEPAVITEQPENFETCTGNDIVLSLTATGDNLSYQWEKNGLPVASATNRVYIIKSASLSDAGSYQCVITSSCGEIISNAVQVKVNEPPVINTSPPALVSECEGNEILLAVDITGDAVSYQWKKNGSVLSNIGNISGSQTPTLRLSSVTAADAGIYVCEITGNCGIKLTTPLTTVNIKLKPEITLEPDDVSILVGGNASFTAFASGEIDSWKWYFNGVVLTDGGNISGANTATVQISGVTADNEGAYNFVVSGSCGEATSKHAILNVLTSSVITKHPGGDIKCEGESITFTIETTGTGHSYQWKKNGVPLNDDVRVLGSQQQALTISELTASDAGSYSCMVDGIENSIPALLYVNRKTKISFLAGENDLCAGETITLFADARGDSLKFNWHKDGIALIDGSEISGSVTGALVIHPADASHSGYYTCTVNGACGSQTSDPLMVEVADRINITSQPRDTTVCEGQPTTISTSTTGTVLQWQWYRNGRILTDNEGISGSKTPNLFIPNAGTGDAGNYYCIVKGPCDSIVTNYATVNIRKNVTITSHPEDIYRCVGDIAVFTINAGISNAGYQWQKEGADLIDDVRISGSKTNTLRIENLQVEDMGSYRCIVTGSCNTVQGNPVVLDISEKTSILSQPAGGTICEGTGFTFSVEATGSSLNYRWIKDGVELSDDGTYSGTHSPVLAIDSATAASAGIYYCLISGTCGELQSDYAVLNVNIGTSVIPGSLANRICEGKDLSISLNARGTALSYQWQKDNNPIADGLHYSGTTGSNLHIINASKAESGNYTCVVTGTCGKVVSTASEVTVLAPPAITTQPADNSLCEGDNLLLKITATGDDLKYSWKLNGIPVGVNTNELFIQDVKSSNGGVYSCLVSSDNCGSENSASAIINVTSPAVLQTSPADFTGCPGEEANFTVDVKGNNLQYKWQFKGVPLTDDLRVKGSDTRSIVISNLSSSDQGSYRCVITDGCGNIINSDAATLTVYEPLTLDSISKSDTVCEGQPVNLFVEVSGTNPTYQWFFNGLILSDGQEYKGTTTASLNIQNVRKENSGYYTCEITGSCGKITTSPIGLLVSRTISITGHPVSLSRCAGENAVFSVTANGDSIKYQWMKDSQVIIDTGGISGSNSSLLLLPDLTTAQSGSYYCIITNSCGSVKSQPASLIVNDYPAPAGLINGETVVCEGSTGLVYSVPAIAGAETYEWSLPFGMNIISGQNTRQITVNLSMNDLGGPVYVKGINACGAGKPSPVLNVKVNPLPVAYAGENTGICDDETILTAFDPGAPSIGSWQVISGPAVIDNPGQALTAARGLRIGENKFSWTVVNNGCSVSDTVTIYNNMVKVEAGNDTSICDHIYRFEAVKPLTGKGKWSIVSGAGYNIDRYNPNSLVSGLSKGINIFKWTVEHNGCSSYDTVIITNNLPSEAEAGKDQFLDSDNTNLSATIPEIGTGEWTLLNGSAVISNPSLQNTQVSNLGRGQNIFEWTVTHKGCISRDTVVIYNSVVDSTDAGPNQVICSNATKLSAKNPYPGYGEWTVKRGSATFDDNSVYNTGVSNLMPGENVLIWTQYLNGITSDSVVIINNLPTSSLAGVSRAVCSDTVTLNANLPYIGTGEWTIVSGSGKFDNPNSNSTRVSDLARGRNDFKWKITNGTCSSSSVVTITNNNPSPAQAGFDVVTCEDSLVLNPEIPTFGTAEWSVYRGSGKFKGNVVYDLGKDENELIYSVRQNGCYSRDTLKITSHKPTSARLGADQSICIDSAIIIGNKPVTGIGTWTIQSGSAIIRDIHSASTLAKNIGPGENIFRWTINYHECSSFDEMIVSNDFVKANAGEDQTGCFDRTVLQANDPGYSSGMWTVLGGSTGASILNPKAPNSTVENLAPGKNILRWTITKNACISYDEVIITNNRPTRAFAGEDAFLCTDELKLRANPVTKGTGTWSVLSGKGSFSDDHDPNATVRGLAPGINVLRWTSENEGCVSTDEVIVANNLPVNVYAGLNQQLCDDSTVLYANPPELGKGSWSVLKGAATFAQPDFYNTTVTGLSNGVNILIWTVSTTGCSAADTVVITNNMATKAIAGSDFSVCNSSGNLNANIPRHGTGLWTLISGAGTIGDPGSASTVIEDLALGSNILQWTITNGDCISSDQLTIKNNSPTIAEAGESHVVCGETSILYANHPAVGTGYWSVISGSGVVEDSLSFNTTVRGLNFGENTLRWTTRNGDCYTSDDITITNNLAYVYAGEDQVVYEPAAVLTGNNPGSGAGRWILIAGIGNLDDETNFTTQISDIGAGLNTFEWSITNGSCTARDQVVIDFRVMPEVGFTVNRTEGCPGMTVDFVNTTKYGTTYLWDMGDGSFSTEVNPRHEFRYTGTFPVKLTAFGPDNKTVTADTVIYVYTKPVADFQFAPDTGIVNKPVRFYNGSFAGASIFLWDFNDGEYSTDENPVHYYRKSGDFDVTLIVNSGFGCADTTTKSINVTEDGIIIFPNAFTPDPNGPNGGIYSDNDYSNDIFHPYYENVVEYRLEIYSRWGVLLFETDDIRKGWDGYYKGKLLERDVYVWKATGKYVSGTPFLKTGNLLLIRD